MIYFAAPLFTPAERNFNQTLAERIEQFSPVFLPQRDGALLTNMLGAGVPPDVAERRIFIQDCDAMRRSNALIAVLDGAHVDEGVAFEVGYMFASGKPCIALQTDVRRALPTGNNLMIGCALQSVCSTEHELLEWISANVENWTTKTRIPA